MVSNFTPQGGLASRPAHDGSDRRRRRVRIRPGRLTRCAAALSSPPGSTATPSGLASRRSAEPLPPSWNVAPTDPVYGVVEVEGGACSGRFRWGAATPLGETGRNRPHQRQGRDAAGEAGVPHGNTQPDAPSSRPTAATSGGGVMALEPRTTSHSTTATPMGFAGIWSGWCASNGERLVTCAIVTGDPNRRGAALPRSDAAGARPSRLGRMARPKAEGSGRHPRPASTGAGRELGYMAGVRRGQLCLQQRSRSGRSGDPYPSLAQQLWRACYSSVMRPPPKPAPGSPAGFGVSR